MNYGFETFSVVHGTLIATGFCDVGPPFVYYEGVQLPCAYLPIIREDLVADFGAGATGWGFRLSALLPSIHVEHAKITLRFTDGHILESPGIALQQGKDAAYLAIFEEFRRATQSGGSLLEIGSRARSGNTYRDLFGADIDYTGIDIADGPNVTIVGDGHHLSRVVDKQFDFVFSISVFEHLLMPWKVAVEMGRVMRMGGLGFIQSHSSFPLHEEPWDFWRFSEHAWRGLFNVATGFEVVKSGYAGTAWTVPALASGFAAQGMDMLPNYLISGCLIRKVAEPTVDWACEASDIYDLSYSHA